MLILFPSDYSSVQQVEPDYLCEYEAACSLLQFKAALFNYDAFVSGESLKLSADFDEYSGHCIYRGWMLRPGQYER